MRPACLRPLQYNQEKSGIEKIYVYNRVFLRKMFGTRYGPVGSDPISLIVGTRIGSLKHLKKIEYNQVEFTDAVKAPFKSFALKGY